MHTHILTAAPTWQKACCANICFFYFSALRAAIKQVRQHGADMQQYTAELSALVFARFESTLGELQSAFVDEVNPNCSFFHMPMHFKER